MREVMPTQDISRTTLTQGLQAKVTSIPTTMNGLANWLEEYVAKVEFGIGMKCKQELLTIMTVANEPMDNI
eukprot:12907292-Prorocentrum_lima.AAC.1